jgi:adenine phosphoribosyltransferase
MEIKNKLRHVMDFPKTGVDFIDITTVLQDKDAFKETIDQMRATAADLEFDLIVGSESRGFMFAATLAYALGKGFVPVRKKGKLPYETISTTYSLEYGEDVLEMNIDAVKPGQKVLVVDDLLATGGTVKANAELVEKLGGTVSGMLFFIELTYLNGRDKLTEYDVRSIVQFAE